MKSKTNPMLLIDFYKAVHAEMLPKNITKSVSYFTPRMSRVKRWGKVVMFGLQGFIKTYLIDYFNEEFFDKPFEEIIYEYKRIMDASLGKDTYKIDKIENLHKLGYLPIEIVALPEGTIVPMHVPMFGITNTHKDFAWLPQALESLVSAEMWHPMLAATVGKTYRDIVNYYYDLTCDDSIPKSKALGAFDFRGEECLESAVKAGAGWCLSFLNTATVPTIPYLEKNYFCDCTKEDVAYGSPSTEHSVMCSNYAIDGDEITLLKDKDEIDISYIEELVYDKLITKKQRLTAKAYEGYRCVREFQRENMNTTDEQISELLSGSSDYWNNENSNKNPKLLTTQRDYMAGILSTDITRRFLLPPEIVQAHDEGMIHFHDADYYAQNAISNCCLINLEDMLQNGTCINKVTIDKPHRLITATTIATQIITAVTSSQYGGATITLTHLAPFVRDSFNIYMKKYKSRGLSYQKCLEFSREDIKKEIADSVQTFNYQVNSMTTTNG